MNFLSKTRLLLIVIIFVAFLLRFYKVTEIPPALTWDEVSIGYNAWSIWNTGKDEHGRLLPLDTFIAYGDYKPPVSIYLTAPFVGLLGLNELSVRLPVVIVSTVTILLTYALVKVLFSTYKFTKRFALLTAAVLAVSPWHINISRAGFEAVIALFFVVLGVLIILSSKNKQKLQLLMWLPFVAAMYTFNSARYFLPFFALLLLWFTYGKELQIFFSALLLSFSKSKSKSLNVSIKITVMRLMISVFIASIFMLPLIPHLLSPEARLRFKEVNIFSDPLIVTTANARIEHAGNSWWANVLNNRRVGYGLSYMKHYLDHFDPSFLFIKGDGNPKFSIQDTGQFYIVEAVFLAIGWYMIFSTNVKLGILLLGWLLLAIVPAGVARETPHALRILNTLPTWHIAIAVGIASVWDALKRKSIRYVYILNVVLMYTVFIVFYLHNYYAHYPYEFSGEWQYGYKQALEVTESLKDRYDHIVVSEIIGRPYMYALFYGKYSPQEFWESKTSFFDAAGFYKVKGFGKYTFVESDVPELEGNILYVLPPHLKPVDATVIKHITLLNGTEVLTVFE